MYCYFVSDLHGTTDKYQKLFNSILIEKPDIVLIGGDLLPHYTIKNFVATFLKPELDKLKQKLKDKFPQILIIPGNNDPKSEESQLINLEKEELCIYLHFRKIEINKYKFFGYAYSPPSPFLLKDWEKYDVTRNTGIGCISPEHGIRTIEIPDSEKKYSTIKNDLKTFADKEENTNTIFLFHAPPYKTNLDRAALDGKKIDNVELDVYVGSKAIRNFIESFQPYLTLHGHIHESSRLTGRWKDKIGNTHCFSAAHDGKELAIVKFHLENLDNAYRELI